MNEKFALSLSASFVGAPGEECFAEYEAYGIKLMELDNYKDTLDLNELCETGRRHGVTVRSFHLPFYDKIDVSSLNEEKRAFTIASYKTYIDRASAAGIRIFVCHPSSEPIGDDEREARLAQSKKTLAELAAYAAARGAVIAIEDLPRSCLGRDSFEIVDLLSADPRLRVAFDTNHLLREDPADFVRRVGAKIVTTHVSDYDFKNERHVLPGEGFVDWADLIAALDEVGYEEPLNYELGKGSGWFAERREPITTQDLVDNYAQLRLGQIPVCRDTGVSFPDR